MKHINIKSIEQSINKVDNLDDDGLENIAEHHSLAQPVLLGYAMQAALEYENEKLEGLIIYYFCLILEAFHQQGHAPKTITEDMIDDFEEGFFEMLDEYFKTEKGEIIEEFSDQPELIQFMFMEISEPDSDGTELDDETATQLFIVCAAMISLLSRASE